MVINSNEKLTAEAILINYIQMFKYFYAWQFETFCFRHLKSKNYINCDEIATPDNFSICKVENKKFFRELPGPSHCWKIAEDINNDFNWHIAISY